MSRKSSILVVTTLAALATSSLVPTEASARGGFGGGFHGGFGGGFHGGFGGGFHGGYGGGSRAQSFRRVSSSHQGSSWSRAARSRFTFAHLHTNGGTTARRWTASTGSYTNGSSASSPTKAPTTFSGSAGGSTSVGGYGGSNGTNKPTGTGSGTSGYAPNGTLGGNAGPTGPNKWPRWWPTGSTYGSGSCNPPNTTLGGNAGPTGTAGTTYGSASNNPAATTPGGNAGPTGPSKWPRWPNATPDNYPRNITLGGLTYSSRPGTAIASIYKNGASFAVPKAGTMTLGYSCRIAGVRQIETTIENALEAAGIDPSEAKAAAKMYAIDIEGALQSAMQYAPTSPGTQQVPLAVEMGIVNSIYQELVNAKKRELGTGLNTKQQDQVGNQANAIARQISDLMGNGYYGSQNSSGFSTCDGSTLPQVANIVPLDATLTNDLTQQIADLAKINGKPAMSSNQIANDVNAIAIAIVDALQNGNPNAACQALGTLAGYIDKHIPGAGTSIVNTMLGDVQNATGVACTL